MSGIHSISVSLKAGLRPAGPASQSTRTRPETAACPASVKAELPARGVPPRKAHGMAICNRDALEANVYATIQAAMP